MSTEWEQWEGRSRWRRWMLRLLALLALVGVLGGLYAIYQAAIADDGPAPTGIDTELQAIAKPAGELADALEALEPRSRNRTKARRAAARAIAATRAARRAYDADPDIAASNEGARIDNAVDLEREYLNAVAATLKDPASRLQAQLPARAGRARRALDALPDDFGLAQEVRGVKALRAWAKANDR